MFVRLYLLFDIYLVGHSIVTCVLLLHIYTFLCNLLLFKISTACHKDHKEMTKWQFYSSSSISNNNILDELHLFTSLGRDKQMEFKTAIVSIICPPYNPRDGTCTAKSHLEDLIEWRVSSTNNWSQDFVQYTISSIHATENKHWSFLDEHIN